MKTSFVIVEDEKRSARFLKKQLQERGLLCLAVLASVEDALLWFSDNPHPDLVFSDIQLGDGLSFDIYDQVALNSKIIFTTAFDQYSIQAFKHNSIDYLLKPIRTDELDFALNQYHSTLKSSAPPFSTKGIRPKSFKNIFLQKTGNHLKTIKVADVAYVYTENKILYFKLYNGPKIASDFTLEFMKQNLNPDRYFQINRQMMIHFEAIEDILILANNRLKLKLNPNFTEDVFVSRDRVKDFKLWLDSYE